MLKFSRTNSENPDFHLLTKQLDTTLCEIYGTKLEDYEEYNRITDLPTVILAYQNEVPVGCGCFKKFNEDTIELKRMFVLPEYRGQGIATRLVYEIETWALELNYTYAALETGNKQTDAINLYQNLGYTITNNFNKYADNDFSVYMLKSLWAVS